jgi:tetratricopeptide (TPR) repeat protein
MPNVIEAGWIIEDMSEEDLNVCINIASSGLTRMMTILEDGYLNHSSADSQFGWDEALRSAVVLDSDCEYGINAAGLSTWIPVCRVGFALNDTYIKAPHALKSSALGELEEISFNGAGPLVANCINSLVFSHLIDSEYYYMIDRLLEAAFLLNVGEESTNALSNWGIAMYKRGELDEAVSKFEQALAREDKYAEAEASWWLAKIYTELGNVKKSIEFEKRCLEAGGYGESKGFEPESKSKIGSPSSDKSNGSGLIGQSKFCSNCGSAFQEIAIFCSNCGTKRL